MAGRLQEIRNIRIEKLKKLKELGLSGYPAHSTKSISNGEIIANFATYENQSASLTGRLMALREHGHLIFGDLVDATGKVQIFIKDDAITPTDQKTNALGFADLNLLDVGDFVQVDGTIVKTKTGAISIAAKTIHLLTKSLRPLPDNWNGIEDKDLMFRRRYLDLTLNEDRRAMFVRKSKFWSVARNFMQSHGFIEVETPVLEHVTGGADAAPFTTHHNALDETFYLRISTELYEKRLIGGGFEKIYTLAPNFRNEGIDDEHLQEYYQLEWYWAYADYRNNMALTRDLFREIANEVYGKTVFTRGEHTFDLAKDWEEVDYAKSIEEKLGVDIYQDSEDKMRDALKKAGVKLDGLVNKSRLIDNLWKVVRKGIAGPAFLVNEPKFMSPLAKSKPENEALTERFHVILAGSELGNGYSELNDPLDQLARFRDQQNQRDSGDAEAQMLDIDFVEMLEYGMPPTSGVGISERVFWFLEGVTAREGTLFPQMKRHIEPLTKEIYGLKDEVKSAAKTTSKGISGVVDQSIKDKFPGMFYAYTTIKGVDIHKSNDTLKELSSKIIGEHTHEIESIGDLKPISEYRKLFKATGAWQKSRRPSPEALLRRLATGKGIYNINTAVDAYNLAVIETAVGLGGFDLSKLDFPVTLRLTKSGEQMHLLGDDAPTTVDEGEIAYADNGKLITLDLNYRDINVTKITEKTKDIVLYADGAPGLTEDEVVAALEKGANYIKEFCGGEISKTEIVR